MSLADLLAQPDLEADAVASHLQQLAADRRVEEVVALSPAAQRGLWQLASRAAGQGELVPAGTAGIVVFAGRNSLGFLSRFEKRFTMQGGAVIGYNRHPLRGLIGPGYFTAEGGAEGRLRFDYGRIPGRPPESWPAVRGNDGFPARLVYGNLVDDVVWVSADVLVGSASRAGRELNSYFVLARRPG
jgi:hypothetical protein